VLGTSISASRLSLPLGGVGSKAMSRGLIASRQYGSVAVAVAPPVRKPLIVALSALCSNGQGRPTNDPVYLRFRSWWMLKTRSVNASVWAELGPSLCLGIC